MKKNKMIYPEYTQISRTTTYDSFKNNAKEVDFCSMFIDVEMYGEAKPYRKISRFKVYRSKE